MMVEILQTNRTAYLTRGFNLLLRLTCQPVCKGTLPTKAEQALVEDERRMVRGQA
jgi:hypothetical protein